MSETNRIREIFDARGIRPTVFARENGLPYSTISSIYNGAARFERIWVGNFAAIAYGLSMTLDELWTGKRPDDLTKDEAVIIDMYRRSGPFGRHMIMNAARTAEELAKEEEGFDDESRPIQHFGPWPDE